MVALVAAFAWFLCKQRALAANLARLDFWGALMLANIALVLAVILAFWVEVRLTDTLWTLLFLVPVTLFLFNKGLAGAANCDVRDDA